MNLERFIRERGPSWDELDGLARAARGRAERLGPSGALRLGELYRGAVADLAMARRKWPADPCRARLEDLVGRARHLVYDRSTRRRGMVAFLATDYWRLVARRPLPLLVAALLLLGVGALAGAWAAGDPVAASGLVPSAYHSVTEPRRSEDLGIPIEQQAALSSSIFTNNIQVSFLAFAGGIAAGIVTVWLVGYNGLQLGAVAGLAVSAGNGPVFFELVTAHGVLELSCIVVTAGAGLRLGWAMIEPHRMGRVEAVTLEARDSVQIVLGTIPWLILAGLIEGFVTPAGLGLPAVLVIGFAVGGLYWGLMAWRGKAS